MKNDTHSNKNRNVSKFFSIASEEEKEQYFSHIQKGSFDSALELVKEKLGDEFDSSIYKSTLEYDTMLFFQIGSSKNINKYIKLCQKGQYEDANLLIHEILYHD